MMIHIKNHLWMDGGSVGIASTIEDDVDITIGTMRSNGSQLYPGVYKCSKEQLMAAPVRKFSKGTPVRVVRISDLEHHPIKEMEDLI